MDILNEVRGRGRKGRCKAYDAGREAYFIVRFDIELDFFACEGADSLIGIR